MIYSTPSKEFDGVTVGLRLIVAATDLIALCEDQPERTSEYLGEAANLIHDAWMAVQTAYGRALNEAAALKEQAGYRLCVQCHQYKPKEQTEMMASRQEAKDEAKTNHWVVCRACLGLPVAHQASLEPDLDPFESEEGP